MDEPSYPFFDYPEALTLMAEMPEPVNYRVAIVGGPCAGKTTLAEALWCTLQPKVSRLKALNFPVSSHLAPDPYTRLVEKGDALPPTNHDERRQLQLQLFVHQMFYEFACEYIGRVAARLLPGIIVTLYDINALNVLVWLEGIEVKEYLEALLDYVEKFEVDIPVKTAFKLEIERVVAPWLSEPEITEEELKTRFVIWILEKYDLIVNLLPLDLSDVEFSDGGRRLDDASLAWKIQTRVAEVMEGAHYKMTRSLADEWPFDELLNHLKDYILGVIEFKVLAGFSTDEVVRQLVEECVEIYAKAHCLFIDLGYPKSQKIF